MENFNYRNDRVGGFGEFPAADRQRQYAGLGADTAGFVNQHSFWGVREAREVNGAALGSPMPTKQEGAVAQHMRRGNRHHFVGSVLGGLRMRISAMDYRLLDTLFEFGEVLRPHDVFVDPLEERVAVFSDVVPLLAVPLLRA